MTLTPERLTELREAAEKAVTAADQHAVVFAEDRWTVEHSVACRASGQMATCEVHQAIDRVYDEPDPDIIGRWFVTAVDEEGCPSLVRADDLDHLAAFLAASDPSTVLALLDLIDTLTAERDEMCSVLREARHSEQLQESDWPLCKRIDAVLGFS